MLEYQREIDEKLIPDSEKIMEENMQAIVDKCEFFFIASQSITSPSFVSFTYAMIYLRTY